MPVIGGQLPDAYDAGDRGLRQQHGGDVRPGHWQALSRSALVTQSCSTTSITVLFNVDEAARTTLTLITRDEARHAELALTLVGALR